MRKIFLLSNILLTLLLAAGIPLLAQERNNSPEWIHFSKGLLLKQQALEATGEEREKLCGQAIEELQKATKGEDPSRPWFHIGECYYQSYRFQQALAAADKAIAADPSFFDPYQLKYRVFSGLRNQQEAGKVLAAYIETHPDDIRVRYMLAEHYYQANRDMEKAAGMFQSIIDRAASLAVEEVYREQAWFRLGEIAYRENNLNRALYSFEMARRVNPSNTRTLRYLALFHLHFYNLDKAVKYADAVLRENPSGSTMHMVRGRVLYLRNDPAAISHLRQSADNESVQGYISAGLLLEMRQQDSNALQYLLAVHKYNKDLAETHIASGKIYERKGQQDAAFTEYLTAGGILVNGGAAKEAYPYLRKARTIKPESATVHYYLGIVEESLGNFDAAIANMKEAYRLDPRPEQLLTIGYLHGRNKEYNKARAYFSLYREKEPESAKPWFYDGIISLWEEKYPQAEKELTKAAGTDSTQESYHYYLAVVQEKLGKIDQCIASLNLAIEAAPNSSRAYNFLSYLYAERNIKIDEALKLIIKALEIEPDNGAYLDTLGWIYYRQGRYELALEKLKAAARELKDQNAEDPEVYEHIGDTYLKLGNNVQALHYWQRALELNPEQPGVEKKITTVEER